MNSRVRFTVRVEKPFRIPESKSCPEPDWAWVSRRRYADQHPNPVDIHLLIEVSFSSSLFDTTEKQELYAAAAVVEYWQVDVPKRNVTVYRELQNGRYTSNVSFDESKCLSPLCSPESLLAVKDLFATA